MIKGLHRAMNSATLAYYRLLHSLVSGKRILDLRAAESLGAALLREAGNEVHRGLEQEPGCYDLILALDEFRAGEDVLSALNLLRDRLSPEGTFAVSCRIAAATGVHLPSGELVFRLESLAKLLQDYFAVVSYAFLHGDEFKAEWNQYSDRVIFFCRFLKSTRPAEAGPFLENMDATYGGTIKGLVPFSLAYVRLWLNQDFNDASKGNKGNLLFFLQPLPLYGDPLLYQQFFERYYLLGEEYRELGWNAFYSTTADLKALYGARNTFSPEDFRHPPHLRDWRAVYAKTLDPNVELDDPDIAYWAEYIEFVLDRTRPDAVFVWNKNSLLDRIAAARSILVIHNEICLDRSPRPVSYFFDPQGVNAESALRQLWDRFQEIVLPACCDDLAASFRRTFLAPWLGSGSRVELLDSLGLDPAKKTILIPLQVENDSNVLLNSPFESMTEFCERILDALPAGKHNVIIKPHPLDPSGTKLNASVFSRACVLEGGHPMGPLIEATDCVFTISSTTGYEALQAGKTVVTFGRSVYSHLGLTVDLEGPEGLIELPETTPARELLNKFLFLASIFYPVSEQVISCAKLQEPLLVRALECKRCGAGIFEYWPDPARMDWRKFCFDKIAEWLGKSLPQSGFTPPEAPQIASKTLLAHFAALEQAHEVALRSIAERQAELVELQGQFDVAVRANEKLDLEVLREREKTRQFDEMRKETAILQGLVKGLRAGLSREKRRHDALQKTTEGLYGALHQARETADRDKRRLNVELDSVAHNNAHLRKQLDAEADKSRMLQEELEVARRHALEVESAVEAMYGRLDRMERRLLRNRLKRGLHHSLDFMQALLPERIRRVARPAYLEYVYYRIYAERRPAPVKRLAPASIAKRSNSALLISSYQPYVEFKERLYGGLPLDFRDLSAPYAKGLVSVVLPVHNGARYVAASIESVLQQTYRNLELIIVDDGSIDDTPRILDQYRHDPRVRIIRQANQKLPAALNTGFAQSKGEYRTWTSDDNMMLPEMLRELVNFLDHQADVEMVYADQELIDEDGKPLLQSDYCPGYQTPPGGNLICWPRDPGELNFVQNNYFGACFLYRAWAGMLVGDYSTSLFGFEDYDYWMRMNALFRASHWGQRRSLYRYRVHRTSLSSRDTELQITKRVREFMASEADRRGFFVQPFDIALFGTHPWFDEIASRYRSAGHHIGEGPRGARKSMALFGDGYPPAALDSAGIAGTVIRLSKGRNAETECLIEGASARGARYLLANSAAGLLYPILAGANTLAYQAYREASAQHVALQNA
jgi:glycosyltransferase involved in cell wall biosynthesis